MSIHNVESLRAWCLLIATKWISILATGGVFLAGLEGAIGPIATVVTMIITAITAFLAEKRFCPIRALFGNGCSLAA